MPCFATGLMVVRILWKLSEQVELSWNEIGAQKGLYFNQVYL